MAGDALLMEERRDATDEQEFGIRILGQRRQCGREAQNEDTPEFHGYCGLLQEGAGTWVMG